MDIKYVDSHFTIKITLQWTCHTKTKFTLQYVFSLYSGLTISVNRTLWVISQSGPDPRMHASSVPVHSLAKCMRHTFIGSASKWVITTPSNRGKWGWGGSCSSLRKGRGKVWQEWSKAGGGQNRQSTASLNLKPCVGHPGLTWDYSGTL